MSSEQSNSAPDPTSRSLEEGSFDDASEAVDSNSILSTLLTPGPPASELVQTVSRRNSAASIGSSPLTKPAGSNHQRHNPTPSSMPSTSSGTSHERGATSSGKDGGTGGSSRVINSSTCSPASHSDHTTSLQNAPSTVQLPTVSVSSSSGTNSSNNSSVSASNQASASPQMLLNPMMNPAALMMMGMGNPFMQQMMPQMSSGSAPGMPGQMVDPMTMMTSINMNLFKYMSDCMSYSSVMKASGATPGSGPVDSSCTSTAEPKAVGAPPSDTNSNTCVAQASAPDGGSVAVDVPTLPVPLELDLFRSEPTVLAVRVRLPREILEHDGARAKLEPGCATWEALMAKSKTSIVLHVPDAAAVARNTAEAYLEVEACTTPSKAYARIAAALDLLRRYLLDIKPADLKLGESPIVNTPEIAVSSPAIAVSSAPVVISAPVTTEVVHTRGPRTPSPASSGAVERDQRVKSGVSSTKLAVPRAYRTRSGSQSDRSSSTAHERRRVPPPKTSSSENKSRERPARPTRKEEPRDERRTQPASSRSSSTMQHKPRLDRPNSRERSLPHQTSQRSSLPPRPSSPHVPSFAPRSTFVGNNPNRLAADQRLRLRDRSIRTLQTRAAIRGVPRPPFTRGAIFPGGFNRDRPFGGPTSTSYSRFPPRDQSGGPPSSSPGHESRPRLWTTRARPYPPVGHTFQHQPFSPHFVRGYTRGGYSPRGYTRGYTRGGAFHGNPREASGDRPPEIRSPPARKRSYSRSRSRSRSPYPRSSRATRDYSQSRSTSRSRERSNIGSGSGSRSRRDSSDHQSRVVSLGGSGPRTPPHPPPAASPEPSRVEHIDSHTSSRAMTPSKRSVSSGGSRSFQSPQVRAEDSSYGMSYAQEADNEQPSPPPGNPPTPPLPPPMRPIERSTLQLLAGMPAIETSSGQSASHASVASVTSNPNMSSISYAHLQSLQNLQIQMAALSGAGASAAGQIPLYNLYTIGVNPSAPTRTVLFKQPQLPPGASERMSQLAGQPTAPPAAHASSAAASSSSSSAYYSSSTASTSAGASSGAAQADSERGFRSSDVHARLGTRSNGNEGEGYRGGSYYNSNPGFRGRYWRGGGSYSPQGYRGGGPPNPNYYSPRDPRQGARLYYRGGIQQHAGPGGYQPGRPYMRPRFHPYARGGGGGGGWADDHANG